ncbi:MAG TPA: serine/threonine-protein kinase [Polyangiaceae bacterium]|nr:serine/threonine-protein kinase [Polyangiaceae bacterium]
MAEPRPIPPPSRISADPVSGPESLPHTRSPSLSAINPRICPTCGGRYPADFRVCPRDATPLEDAPSDEDPLVGHLLDGSYEVLRVIGEGGMGRVYEARHTRLHTKRFAVKLLHHELARQPEVVTRFQREAEAASALTHPNVVGVYDVNTSADGRPYIVAELLEGEELGNYLERVGKLQVVEAVHIVRQVCRALGAAHAHGIVHRDVKPENVFLASPNAVVKVLDFGISKVAEFSDGLTKTGTVMGTPDYMAPEQARGDRVDARADIYAVGAILYRALTGRKPFDGLDPMAILTAVLTEEPERPTVREPSIPLALELIVQRTMAKLPAERFQTMEALEQALAPFDAPDASPAVTIISPATAAAANERPPTLMEAAARTLLATPGSGTMQDALEETARNVRLARPGLVFFTGLGLFWGFVNVVVVAAALVRLVRGTDLSIAEVTLSIIGVLATLSSPTAIWIRHLRRTVWPSTPRSVEMVMRLRRTVLYSAAAYGLGAVLVQLFEGVVGRNGLGVARPGWSLFVFVVALIVGALTWLGSGSRKST